LLVASGSLRARLAWGGKTFIYQGYLDPPISWQVA
jgi:hypothetical protein